jgi:hypothetical protein
MNWSGDLPDDMPNLRPRPEQAARDEDGLDRLLSGFPPLSDAPAESRLVADLLTALSAPAIGDELRGSASALHAYRARFGMSRRPLLRTWRPAVVTSVFASKLLVAGAAGAVAVGGLAAAAYSRALPDPAQNVAHQLIDAPSVPHPHDTPGKSGTPVGPDPTGPAAFGLCNAYAHATAHGQAVGHSVAFRNLATAAGGAANIDAFCAKVPHPGSSESTSDSDEPSEGAGRPSDAPAHPTGRPSQLPAHPTGKPSAGLSVRRDS